MKRITKCIDKGQTSPSFSGSGAIRKAQAKLKIYTRERVADINNK